MPVIDEIETKPRPPKRTWRELPPSPPVGAPLPPPDPADAWVPAEALPADAPAPAKRRRRWAVVMAVVAVAGIAVAAFAWRDGGETKITPTVAESEKGSPAAVAKALGPAVVQLEVGSGVGSGVIYADGLVLTAHHVVAATDEPTVKLADGSTFSGRVVGREPERDLAVVAFDGGSDLTVARLAEPGTVEVGESVVALGSPFGFQASVTSGIVSGLDRELDTPAGTLTGLIQTDTAINPGNSGGPLADSGAVVIGINTAIASASGGSDGVGFAIPVEVARDLIATVEEAGGTKAPTVPAPEQSGGLGGLIPGLPQIPGLDKL
ncbi:MAG TPA: trypsin-like peptidase domain-containing protein, partial [Acidimicrobiales bacterium]